MPKGLRSGLVQAQPFPTVVVKGSREAVASLSQDHQHKSEKMHGASGRPWCRTEMMQKREPSVPSLLSVQIPYLSPSMLRHAWRTALIDWLHRGKKLLFQGR